MPAIAEDVRRVGTLANVGDTLTFNQPGTAVLSVNVVITGNMQIVFQYNVDEGLTPTWRPLPGVNVDTGQTVTSLTTSGFVKFDVSSYRSVQAICVQSDGGSAVVTMNGSVAPSSTDLVISKGGVQPLPVTGSDQGGNPQPAATDASVRDLRSILEQVLIELQLLRQNLLEQTQIIAYLQVPSGGIPAPFWGNGS